jgi:hypothetical protein
MTDERLLARLRGRGNKDTIVAADRIEALTAERDAWKGQHAAEALGLHVQMQRAEAAEAKLAKAVEGLRAFKAFDDMPARHKRPDVFEVSVRRKLLATLAEIEGEKT